MTYISPTLPTADTFQPVFNREARARFRTAYPETTQLLHHGLVSHDLLTIPALAELGAALPTASVEYNKGALPIGVQPGSDIANGLTIAETILRIENSASWAVLKNVEQVPEYRALLMQLLSEIQPDIEARTGPMLRPQAYIFISSPDAVTPYHFDPEHNILLQLRGTKTMTVFPAGDRSFAPPQAHETYHNGGNRNLIWSDDFKAHGIEHHMTPGCAVFVPVMAPHFVQNGPAVSISLSITWRSEWSFAEANAHGMNRVLRRFGLNPKPPGRYPANNVGKATAYRVLRKLRLVG